MRRQSSKPWVARIATPYTIFFALACAVSFAVIITKIRLLIRKLRSRLEGTHLVGRKRPSLGGVAIAPELAAAVPGDRNTFVDLKSKFDDLKLQKNLSYCHIATALLEDLPLGKQAAALHLQF